VLTNAPREPWDDPFTLRFVFLTNYVTNLATNFAYSFPNVEVLYSSPTTLVRLETTGVEKEPWSDALNPIYRTNVNTRLVAEPSGGLLIIPTNLLGYEFAPFPSVTNVFGTTNITFTTNFIDPVTFLLRTIQELEIRFFTNVQFAVYPIEVLPAGLVTNIVVTNGFATNITTTFDIRVGNVLTNYFGPTTPATRFVYTIVPNPFNPALSITNVQSFPDTVRDPRGNPVPSGGFLIDTNLTGFEFVRVNSTSIIPITNTVSDVSTPGERRIEQLVYFFTNTVYTVYPFVLQPAPAQLLRGGVDELTFVRLGDGTIAGNQFNYTNRYQITYYDTNGLPVRAAFQTAQTRPDILFGAADLGVTAGDVAIPFRVSRNGGYQNNANLDPTLVGGANPHGGPGTVNPPINIQLSRIGPHVINTFPGFTTEASIRQQFLIGIDSFLWGSFDGSTNPPIVFPRSLTLEEIEKRTAGTVTQ
jgi:hypothetical protein